MKKLIWILGPQAVGKMTTGIRLSERTGMNFMHNHVSIELSLQHFPYGTPGFWTINNAIRSGIFEANAKYSEKGFIFTYMPDFDDEEEYIYLQKITDLFLNEGEWEVYFIELQAALETRLQRNTHPLRLKAKASKREIERTTTEIHRSVEKYKLNSGGDFRLNYPHLIIANDELLPDETVDRILEFCNVSLNQ